MDLECKRNIVSAKTSVFLSFFLVVFSFVCSASVHAEVTTNERLGNWNIAECSFNDVVKFEFTDENKTTFQIPRPYLYKPYPTYNLEKEENYIVLYVQKETLKPSCKNIHTSFLDHYVITIERKTPEGFRRIMKMRTDEYREFIAQEDEFKLYRKPEDLKKTNLVSVEDFLVPPEENGLASFMTCYRPNLKGDVAPRAGCLVFSEISNSAYIKYVVDAKKLNKWRETNTKITNLINNFKIQPKKD